MDWIISQELVDYPYAVSEMERRVAGIRDGSMDEAVWLLEHPPLYTAGTSARAEDLLSPRFPVYDTGRGGQYTYHGPGQRVGYVILDLKKRQQTPDIKKYVWQLEEWVIRSLAEFNVQGERRAGRVGIWVDLGNGQEAKIAALGVRVRHWVTFHGVSINVDPNLSHFNGIVPCGIKEHGVTSLAQLGKNVSLQNIDLALKKAFDTVGF
ncbi:MAG: lipoyl(octanoyl) transferase LipB [Alphaproteobacteria bacterium]|nr:lipoyl(octanoyl) transferase LipB [Alphaproteobacteria bacterium]